MPESFTAGVVVYAKSLSTMTAFYRHVLDIPIREEAPEHVTLYCGTMRLVIHAIPAAIADNIAIQNPPLRREDAAMKLSLPVASLERARTRAAERGGVLDPTDRAWSMAGRRYCDGHDPEGNVLQLHEEDVGC
jgi:predicted enzyme related to lactoylglutathione lyase